MIRMDDTMPSAHGARRLVIHMGVPKTGSTSFHHFVARNIRQLSRRLVVPCQLTGVATQPIGRAAIAYSLAPDSETEGKLRKAFSEILTGLPQNDLPVLLTHENLAGALPGNGGEAYFFPMMPRIARVLVDEARGFDVRIAFYSRQMDKWLESVWGQVIRTDGYSGTYPQFLQMIAEIADWDDLSTRLSDAIGAGKVVRFASEDEKNLLRPGLQLLRLAGLSDGDLDAMEALDQPAMMRLNAGALEFLRQVNASGINPHARNKIANLVARHQPLFNVDFRSPAHPRASGTSAHPLPISGAEAEAEHRRNGASAIGGAA